MASTSGARAGHPEVPSLREITEKTEELLGRRPCVWQSKVAQAVLRGEKDIVCISGTGSGKTLTFWIPLLFRPEGIQVVITPLNLLGSQNAAELQKVGITGIALSGKTATRENFEAIELLRYRVVVVNPEVTFQVGGRFQKLWRKSDFTSKLISVIWDEAHCIKSWASFRQDYAEAGRLRNLISTRFLIPSATLPSATLQAVLGTLQVPRDKTVIFQRSNDRPNVYLTVHKAQYALSSFKDLDFLIPQGWKPGVKIPKFVVFFDSIEDSVKAAQRMQQRLPPEYRDKIMWINSDTTAALREKATEEFARGELLGLYCTDSFGIGIDVPNIEVVVQWRTKCDFDTLWQRFGRAARGPGTVALAILIVESKYFDAEKSVAEQNEKKKKDKQLQTVTRNEQGKRKRSESTSAPGVASTRRRLQPEGTGGSLPTGVASEIAPATTPVAQQAFGSPDSPEAATTVGSGVTSVAQDLSTFERLRVEFKVASAAAPGDGQSQKKKTKGAKQDEKMGVEMDNLVNAAMRPFKCYRAPVTAYYENDRFASKHLECQPLDNDGGCPRCLILPSPVCCSLCSPAHPIFQLLPPPPLPQPQAPRASGKVPTTGKYTMTDKDRQLRDELHQFRRTKMKELFGLAVLRNLGPGLVMGDSILDRIADCARVNKLTSLDALYREMKWDQTWDLGDAVLAIVYQCVFILD
ncbi:transporter [Ganoderma sinense ZZ0214-1]|uniref:DNA 3'-5' helicase n=1 Tax=Ganoderma sinense ZZ0214-1 TaxID=1077348 RepID=A0A2G8RP55_9APHY|nr:transporter [Ganoderma sinense ZZ0214-1]